jgi:hypothetical protein
MKTDDHSNTTAEAQRQALAAAARMKARDCGWRTSFETELPCVHCHRPTRGRNEEGTAAVCFRCWHNVEPPDCGATCGKELPPALDPPAKAAQQVGN